jgi:uncharacterized protein
MKLMPRLLLALACVHGAAAGAAVESNVSAPGPQGPLRGLMLTSGAPHAPLVLIIPGSGPTDHDGNNMRGLRAGTYRLLAEGLAERGIATVRIDKRGLYDSAAASADPNAVTIADYASDVHSWVRALRARSGARCLWLLGHSEGGLVAMVAAQRQPGVCGLLLVATAGRPLGEVLREQLERNPANAPLLHPALATIDALEAGRRVEAAQLPAALLPLFRPQVQGFLISAFSYDPARLLSGYQRPVLILQGQRDLQVGEPDARVLARAAPHARLVLLPDANHVLKSVASDQRAANLATYSDAHLPLAAGVVRAIGDFIEANGAPR